MNGGETGIGREVWPWDCNLFPIFVLHLPLVVPKLVCHSLNKLGGGIVMR